MKNMKKLFALLLTVAMVFTMATSVFAHTIKITGTDNATTTGHEYSVYQIFTGDIDAATKKLTNIKYGSAGVGTLGELVPEDDIKEITNAEAYAKTLDISSLTKYGTLNEGNEFTLTDVPSGYYLIVDDTTKDIATGDTFSKYIVKVVEDVNMAPKSETVHSDKKLYNDAVALADVNDAGVGTVVSYVVNGKIADNAGSYDYYFFIMGDTLSKGLTFNNDITVYYMDGDTQVNLVENTDYKVYKGTEADPHTFEIALLNAKALAGKTIYAKYSATVNSDAVTMIPEKNTFEVIYSRDPYSDVKPDEKTPGKPAEKDKDVLGKTPEKEVFTYETELNLIKEDEEHNKLAGATFKLTSANANQTVMESKQYFELDNTNGTYYLLKNGTYTQTAPSEIDVYFEKTGSKGDNNTKEGYILKDGNYVVPEDVKEYIGQDLYIKVVSANGSYASYNKYALKTATTTSSNLAPVDITLTTDAEGKLSFKGLGSGDYVLKEIDAPDGFNYIEDVKFTINFVEGSDGKTGTFEVTDVSGGATITGTNGVFNTTVVDKSGATLPETGGMGTTIFYVIGGILVAAAGVLLITKKRVAGQM